MGSAIDASINGFLDEPSVSDGEHEGARIEIHRDSVSGVYVYSFPKDLKHPEPDGTFRARGRQIKDLRCPQPRHRTNRVTSWFEDPVLLGHHPTIPMGELKMEGEFHKILTASGARRESTTVELEVGASPIRPERTRAG